MYKPSLRSEGEKGENKTEAKFSLYTVYQKSFWLKFRTTDNLFTSNIVSCSLEMFANNMKFFMIH